MTEKFTRLILGFALMPVIRGMQDCSENTASCQIRTAVSSGITSIIDAIPLHDYEFGKKNLALLGLYDDADKSFCSNVCLTETSAEDFDQIDALLSKNELKIQELKEDQLEQINGVIEDNHGNRETLISVLRDRGHLFNFKIEERLKLNAWFAALPAKKQKLLSKYTQARLYQLNSLNNLVEAHLVNTDLVSSINLGESTNVFEDKTYADHITDLDFAWDAFQRIKKDKDGGLMPGVLLNDFIASSANIRKAKLGVVEMLTSGSTLASGSLWTFKGYCDGPAFTYFQGLLFQSLNLQSMSEQVKGFQLTEADYVEFKHSLEEINHIYESICYSKLQLT